MKIVSHFPTEVSKELGHYVYRLIDPRNGETFYVGKGRGNRVFEHARGELKNIEEGMTFLSEKFQRIREIQNAGLTVQHVIHRHGLTEKIAFEVEGALIDVYPGITNIQDGHNNSDRGSAHAQEIMVKYAAEWVPLDMYSYKVMEINVGRSAVSQNIALATRFAWRLQPDNANQADVIVAVARGIVLEVFEPEINSWKPATVNNFRELTKETEEPERYAFSGGVASLSLREKFIGKRMPERKKGAASPIRYFYGNFPSI